MMCQPVEIDFEEAAIFQFSLLEQFSGTFSDFRAEYRGKKRAGQLVASHPAQNGGRRRSRLTLNRTPHSGGSGGPTFSPDFG
jgi:hypothetical protein